MGILSIILFAPLAAALFFLILPQEKMIRWSAAIFSLIFGLAAIWLWTSFDSSTSQLTQMSEKINWLPQVGIYFSLGIDGLSFLLVLLTLFIFPIAVIGTWTSPNFRIKEFYFFLFLLQFTMLGALLSTNTFLFYVFWEAMLIPMFFLIGIWGGKERIYASIKFFLFTLVGSLLMLIAILYLYKINHEQLGSFSFEIADLYKTQLSPELQMWLFGAFAVAFAIKVPMFPVHSWLPDAHTQAPTAGSVILAAVLLKMGTYGYLRFCLPLFPAAVIAYAPFLQLLAVIGVVYGALLALAQKDIKRLVAYSSVSHLGYVMLGIFSLNMQAVMGANLQMINHGISTGALFLLVGMVYERTHTRQFEDYGGLAKKMPVFATFFLITTLSSIAVPGTNGFVGEFLILLGSFKAGYVQFLNSGDYNLMVLTTIASMGVILGAFYMLWCYQRVFFGKLSTSPAMAHLSDLNIREVALLLPLVVLIFAIGFCPNFFMKPIEKSISSLLQPYSAVMQNAQNKELSTPSFLVKE